MKLFSSFDTEYGNILYSHYKTKYPWKKLVFIEKASVFFRWETFPYLLWMILNLWILLTLKIFVKWEFTFYWFLFVFICSFILFGFSFLKRYIDYYMDFAIITPEEIILCNQEGLFQRNVTAIPESKINSISVKRSWWLYSGIFDTWDITILAEWWNTNGEVIIKHVYRPEKSKEQILQIISQTKE